MFLLHFYMLYKNVIVYLLFYEKWYQTQTIKNIPQSDEKVGYKAFYIMHIHAIPCCIPNIE
jgi:hypothetical protein